MRSKSGEGATPGYPTDVRNQELIVIFATKGRPQAAMRQQVCRRRQRLRWRQSLVTRLQDREKGFRGISTEPTAFMRFFASSAFRAAFQE